MKKNKPSYQWQSQSETTPFENAEEAWFWFIQAQTARNEGARIAAGAGSHTRPCEPIDILKVIERLYRQRILIMDHVLVLRHYGRRLMAPDPYRAKEALAAKLWEEAIERLEFSLLRKGIIQKTDYSYAEAAE